MEYESECVKRFPKVWRHPHRPEIEDHVDRGWNGTQLVTWLADLSREKGIEPGYNSNISLSYVTCCAYVNFRREISPPTPVPPKAIKTAKTIDEEILSKEEKAAKLLDLVIEKSLKQLESGEKVTLQNALQALQIRAGLERVSKPIEIKLTIEVQTVVSQLVGVFMGIATPDQRRVLADRVRLLPALRETVIDQVPDSLQLTNGG